MKLIEIIKKLHEFDEEHTIYAREPWDRHSEAIVCLEPENGRIPSEAEGLKYFLEVFIAKEVKEEWSEGKCPKLEVICDRIIYYAVNDA